jgi:CheY-like chemotaxis protein
MNPEIPRDMLQNWEVVVVDDDPASLDIAASLLQFYGATVYRAKNGEEGVRLTRAERPALVITDLSMPVMDGWELIKRLKEERTTLEIPIIALTAHGRRGDRARAIELGCHNFLNKPLTPYTFIKDLLTLLVDIPDLAIRLQSGTA